MGLSSIFLANPIGKPGFILLDYVDTLIGRAAVDDDIFQIRVTLKKDRADRLLDELALVVAGRDDRDARPRAPVGPRWRQGRRLERPRPTRLTGRRGRQVSEHWTAHLGNFWLKACRELPRQMVTRPISCCDA